MVYDPRIKITRWPSKRRDRPYAQFHFGHSITEGDRWAPFNPGVDTAAAALTQRVLSIKGAPQPLPRVNVRRFLRESIQTFKNCIGVIKKTPLEDVPLLQKGDKFLQYSRAVESIQSLGGLEAFYTSMPDRLQIEIFPKLEKSDQKNGFADPRAILPPCIEYRAAMMQFWGKTQEHAIYAAINEVFGYRTVMKGEDPLSMFEVFEGHWNHFRDPIYVAADCHRFDAHFNRHQKSVVDDVLVSSTEPVDRREASGLLKRLNNVAYKGRFHDGKLKAIPPNGTVTLCSGVPVTSLSAIVVVTLAFHAWAHKNRAWDKLRLVLMGDDFGCFCDKKDEGLFRDFTGAMNDLGHKVVPEPAVTVFEQIRFCQMGPVRLDPPRMIRAVETLPRDLIKLKHDGQIPRDEWLYAVGECGYNWTKGCPVLSVFYDLVRQEGVPPRKDKLPYMKTGLAYWGKKVKIKGTPAITADARVSFALFSGWTPSEQIDLETWLVKVTQTEC